MPRVSVVLPTYNRERWLPEAIASVQSQTFADWELLIVDDGSTDGSVERVPRDTRIRIIAREHSGHLATVRQAGVTASTGEFVAFLDSDDRWHADKLALQLAALDRRPDCGWCHGPTQVIDPDGARVRGAPFWKPREGDVLPDMIEGEVGIALQSVLVRQPLAVRVGFDRRLPFGEDFDFVLNLAMAAPACAVDTVVADIRVHPGRTTNLRHDLQLGVAMSFWKCRTAMKDRTIKRQCRRRAIKALREFLAQGRTKGTLMSDLISTARAAASLGAGERARPPL